jgi:hypothetical protein
MERIEPVKGYVLDGPHAVEKLLAVQEALLRSEGIDPRWPGFPEDHERDKEAE